MFEMIINRTFVLFPQKPPFLYEAIGIFSSTITHLQFSGPTYPMGKLQKKKSSFCLFKTYLDNEVVDGQQCPELFHIHRVSSAIPWRITYTDFKYPDMDIDKKDVTNAHLEDYGLSEGDITLCTVTMLGVVMQWQPWAEDIKEVCLKTSHDHNITAVIYDSYTFHDRYSYSLLDIWTKQLWTSGFWANSRKMLESQLQRLQGCYVFKRHPLRTFRLIVATKY
jgi:hypothetical protein